MNFDKFNEMIDVNALKTELAEAEAGGSKSYEEVPDGNYVVVLDKLTLKESSKGNPMVSAWFKIDEGDKKGQIIFMNQVITSGAGLAIALEILKSLQSGVEVYFSDFNQFAYTLEDIKNECDKLNLAFNLKYGTNNKGYHTYKIEEVFEG